ncbi:MAG: glycohydrolase toxin TNT-related protein [Roseburia sp. 1XD42-69]
MGVLMAPVTGGASLGLTVISGTATAGTGLTTSGMVRNSRETGYQPDSTEIAENLIMGGCVGAMTGAFILDIIASVPACAVAAGVTVSMSLGTSALTTSIIPPIVETASYGVAVLSGVFTANEIYSRNAGHNELLEKVFKNNTSAYEGFGEILALICMGIITTGTANSGLVSKKGVYYENNESVEDFIKNNVHPGFQQNVKEAFMSDARVTTLKQNTTVYRYHGGGSSGNSYCYTPNQTANPGGDLALPPGNTYQYMDTYIVPEGTTILEGTVAPNFGQPGGGYQFYVPDPSVVKKQ